MSDILDDLFGSDWQEDTESWPKPGSYPGCVPVNVIIDTINDKKVFKLEFKTSTGRQLTKIMYLQKSDGSPNPNSLSFFRQDLAKCGFNTEAGDSISTWFGKVQDYLLSGVKVTLEVVQNGKWTNTNIQGKTDEGDEYDGPIEIPVDENSDIPF